MRIIPSPQEGFLGPHSDTYRIPTDKDFQSYLGILIKYVEFFHDRPFEIDISDFEKQHQLLFKPLLKLKNVKIL